MNHSLRAAVGVFCIVLANGAMPATGSDATLLSTVHSQADLDALTAKTADPSLKKALQDESAAILTAADARPHVDAVASIVESNKGKVDRLNVTPPALKAALGGDAPLFDTLRLVDLSIPNAGPHDVRKSDPYDAAFFEHLGHLSSLESLNVIATKCSDAWVAPLGKLANLKTLRFTNNGKLTDAGLEELAGLKNVESFGFVGTAIQGHAFAKFDGWTKLRTCSFRGSSIDDEGLRLIGEKFPNLESISLAHAKFTDAGAPALAKLTKLKSLELGTKNASAAALGHILKLPLENLQLGEGFEKPESVAAIAGMSTVRRLTLTDTKGMNDADLQRVAAMTQLQSLELNNLDIPAERVEKLKAFSYLKSLRLVKRPQAYSPELQGQIKAALPGVVLKFE